MEQPDSQTRRRILHAALKIFAHCGYAGASVQAIVSAARVTKPSLYYYFENKAGLYQALIDWAHDERFRLMQEAAGRHAPLPDQLTAILAALFRFIHGNRALMRIAFATAFAASGEIPKEINHGRKAMRNFEFMHTLIKRGLKAGVLDKQCGSRALTMAIYGMMTIKVMEHLVNPQRRLTDTDARSIVQLYLRGATPRKS